MVRICSLLFVLLALFNGASAAEVKMFAEIQQEGAYEDQPLKGLITITHDKNDPVDTQSFRLENKVLAVDFVKDVRISPPDPTVLSIYSFQIPGQPAGLYALPVISVRIGSKEYQSIRTSYTVSARASAKTTRSTVSIPQETSTSSSARKTQETLTSSSVGKTVLRLEAGVNGKTTLYPGQRTEFQYRYYFEGNIALSLENVPLLEAKGFVKIGEKEIIDRSEGNVSIREISQVVEAVEPGTYSFGPSVIEGYAYQNDAMGNPVYTSSKLVSEAPTVTITVLPFAKTDQPVSFNGAVGSYTFQTQLVSSSNVEVGDEISLALLISGNGNLKSVPIPDLCCQPGYSGFFKLSDLPPVEEVSEGTKKAVVKLRVLTDQVKKIPSAEFSYFDPDISNYVVLHSKPIPIHVTPSRPVPVSSPISQPQQKNENKPMEKIKPVPTPIEIESIIPLNTADLYNKPFGTWWVLMTVPLIVVLLIYQVQLRNFLVWSQGQAKAETSSFLFHQAFATQGVCHFNLLKRAFLQALFEAGEIPSVKIEEKDLASGGLSGEVKLLLLSIDEQRFAGKGEPNLDEVRSQSEALLKKIRLHVYTNKELY